MVYEIRALWEDAAVDQGTTREDSARYRAIRILETALCRKADAITTICQGLADALSRRDIPKNKIDIVPIAIDPERFSAISSADPSLIRALGLEGCTVLGFNGSFYSYEGLVLLIDAVPALLVAHPDLRLLLIGGGQDGKVIFTGRIPHDQVLAQYELIDVCVYPRLPMSLTELVTPLQPLEAMAAGRIVVASDVGGHRELIQDGDIGFLFKAGYLVALIDCINEILASRERWPQMRVCGRRSVAERSWRSVTKIYRPLFERQCREKAAA